MAPATAAIVYAIGIMGLFWLDREANDRRTSTYLWISVTWLSLSGSRSLAEWMTMSSPAESAGQYDEGNPINRLVYSSLITAALLVLINRRRKLEPLFRANLPILIFFVYCAISVAWSDYASIAFKRWVKAVGDFMMVLVVITDSEPTLAIKRFLSRTTFLLIPCSVLLIRYIPELGRTYNQFVWTPVYVGVTTNKNGLGQICLLCGLASLWRVILHSKDSCSIGRMRHTVAHGVIVIMVMWLLRMADSVTSLFCFGLGSALLILLNVPVVYRRRATINVLVASVIILTVAVLFLNLGAGVVRSATGRDTTTLTERTEVWKLVLGMVTNPLVGTGFDSFWAGKRLEQVWRYNKALIQAHNGYIETYLNLGLIGVGMLLMVLLTGYQRAVDAIRRQPTHGSLLVSLVVVGAIYNLTEATFKMMTPVWILLLLAISSSSAHLHTITRRSTRTSSPVGSRGLPVTAIITNKELV